MTRAPVDTGATVVVADIGGRPVARGGRFRRGLLYRVPVVLTGPDDLAHLGGLGLRLLVDLRGEAEERAQLAAWAGAHNVGYHHASVPLGSLSELVAEASRASAEVVKGILRSVYRRILDEHGSTLAEVVARLGTGFPAAFGCAVGRDRTGLLSALLQATAGVADDDIVEDYCALAPSAERIGSLLRQWLPDADLASPGVDTLLGTHRGTMQATLVHLREHWGGAAGFLKAHGMTAEAIEHLRHQLIEP
jgi:protein-tyrosine phosphatase